MPITGGIKLFDKSNSLLVDGSSIVSSTGNPSSEFTIDRNRLSYWRSVGSNDTIVETLTITLPSAKTISRILVLDHNWKEFTIKYDSGTNFTTVVGIDGALGGGISETLFSENTAYYEFDSVSVTSTIEIAITKTQIANEEKYSNQIIATSEIATLAGYPDIRLTQDRNLRTRKTLNGRSSFSKSNESFNHALEFIDYPVQDSSFRADIDTMFTLFDREKEFIVWPCGGRRGSLYFNLTLRGFRLKDAITTQVFNIYESSYKNNIYVAQANLSVDLQEVI